MEVEVMIKRIIFAFLLLLFFHCTVTVEREVHIKADEVRVLTSEEVEK
jgi:hypothetical protein